MTASFKRQFIKAMVSFLSVFALLMSFGSTVVGKKADLTIRLHPLLMQQRIDGFGTSAAWWSHKIEDDATRTDILKQLYSPEGLGLNIYRYNVGAGVNPEHNRVGNDWHKVESFYVPDEETGGWTYDFTRDANAQKALFEALSYGCIDTVVLFANSPHYSMTVSGEPSGGFEEYQSNLRKDSYQDFVDYFLTITEYFLSKDVPVRFISPINEPQWGWGGGWVHQEGCHYETDEIAELMHLFAVGIEERGLDVKLSVPESGEIGWQTEEYFTALGDDPVILRNIGSFAYHSYWKDTRQKDKQAFGDWYAEQKYSCIPLEMSEWCELPNGHATTDPMAAVIMARVIADDFWLTGVNSWTSWVAVNQRGWHNDGTDFSDGLFSADNDYRTYDVSYRYYALKHFSSFVPVGSRMIAWTAAPDRYQKPEDERAVDTDCAAFLTPDGKQVLVLSNEGDEKLVRLGAFGNKMEIYTTDVDHKCEQTYAGKRLLRFTVPAQSVTTVVIRTGL